MNWQRKHISNKDICTAYFFKPILDSFADAILAGMFPGCPEKVIYAAMERAVDDGLIEYGTSLRSGWLTEEGKALLSQQRKT